MRDRSPGKPDEQDTPEVTFEPAPAMVDAVNKGEEAAHEPAPEAEAEAPQELSEADAKEKDLKEALARVGDELIRVKQAHGEDAARIVGEQAVIRMRRA